MTRLKQLLMQLPPLQIEVAQPLKTFTLFSQLPPEIRVIIWGHAALVPRDVKVFMLEADRRSSRVEGQSLAPAIMHTSREARNEGKRYYALWKEKCPQEGRNMFRDFYNLVDIQIRPSEHVKNARPNFNNKIWVNIARDRFIFQNLTGTDCPLSVSLADYNFCLNDMLKIRHGGGEVDTILGRTRTSWALAPLLKIEKLQSAVILITNWKNMVAPGIEEVRDQPEETLATELALKCSLDWLLKFWEGKKRRGTMLHIPTVKFELGEDIDLPPCGASSLSHVRIDPRLINI